MNIPLSALYDTSGAPVEAEVFDVGNELTFTGAQLEDSPSRKEAISKKTEDSVRIRSCEIVYGVLTLCGVDRTVICTAQLFLHRYYCQRSVAAFNYKYVALGVIFLALKTEETNITEEEVIPIFCRFLHRAYTSEEKASQELGWILRRSTEFGLWWDWLVCIEMEILIAFGFKLHVPRPHKLMFAYMQKLELTQLMQEAWTALNDSYSTTACVLLKAEDLACGAIFYTTRKHKVALPEGCHYPWWVLFGASEEALYQFALLLHELYNRPEDDFDFTCELDITYRNERADGLKKPHPRLLQRVPDPSPDSQDTPQASPEILEKSPVMQHTPPSRKSPHEAKKRDRSRSRDRHSRKYHHEDARSRHRSSHRDKREKEHRRQRRLSR